MTDISNNSVDFVQTANFEERRSLTYNYVKLPIDLTKVEPAKPEEGDYSKPVRNAIAEAMPYLSADTEGTVDITLDQNVFKGFLGRVKETIRAEAARLNTRMFNLQLSLDNQRNIAEVSENPIAVASAKESITSLESQLSGFKTKYDMLIERRDNTTSREILDRSMPSLLLRAGGGVVKVTEVEGTSAKGEVIIPLSEKESSAGQWQMQEILEAEENRKFSDKEVAVIDRLAEEGRIENRVNTIFFTKGASREPELAGVWGALVWQCF